MKTRNALIATSFVLGAGFIWFNTGLLGFLRKSFFLQNYEVVVFDLVNSEASQITASNVLESFEDQNVKIKYKILKPKLRDDLIQSYDLEANISYGVAVRFKWKFYLYSVSEVNEDELSIKIFEGMQDNSYLKK